MTARFQGLQGSSIHVLHVLSILQSKWIIVWSAKSSAVAESRSFWARSFAPWNYRDNTKITCIYIYIYITQYLCHIIWQLIHLVLADHWCRWFATATPWEVDCVLDPSGENTTRWNQEIDTNKTFVYWINTVFETIPLHSPEPLKTLKYT